MKLLFCGDVVGKSGRRAVLDCIPKLRQAWDLDMVVVNGENAAHGFGLNAKIFNDFLTHGVDVVTLGNHAFDKPEIIPVLEESAQIVRPLNLPENTVGSGVAFFTLPNGKRVAVVQLLGQVYMKPVDSAFETIQKWMTANRHKYDVLIVDIHAEASAEKNALAHFLDGHAALVVGTHTHIPTADARIFPNGAGFMTDVGMCGDYYSVIGMGPTEAINRFFNRNPRGLSPATGPADFCAVYVEIDDVTNKCVSICPVRLGARLDRSDDEKSWAGLKAGLEKTGIL